MARYSTYRYLLALFCMFNLARGTLQRIQYRRESINGNARMIAHCTKEVTSAMFEPSNRVVVIVLGNSTLNDDSSMTNNFLKFLTNSNKIDNTVSVANESRYLALNRNWQSIDGDSSYVVIGNDFENLGKIFQTKGISKWSEYLIVTRINKTALQILSNSLWRYGFVKLAFLHIKNETELVLGNVGGKISRNSKYLNEIGMRSLPVCRKKKTMPKGEVSIEPFSSILCPTSGCSLTVGRVKNDMVGSAPVAESRREFDAADRILNAFVQRYRLEWKNRSTNEGNWTDILHLIHRHEIDLAYGSFIPRIESLENLDFASWFGFETVIFVDMTKYAIVPPLTKIFFPFDGYVWICVFFSLTLCSIFAGIIEQAHRRKLVVETITHFDIWAVLLGQGVKNPSKIGFRTVLGMWMLASLIINAAYSCAFKSAFTPFTRLETLKTMDDVNDSGRQIAGTEVTRELFNNPNDESDREIYQRWKIVPSDQVFPVVIRQRIIGVDNVLNVKLQNLLHRKRFHPTLYALKDPILVYPLNFYLKKRHPFAKHFQKLVSHARDAGLVEKWNIDDFNDVENRAYRKYRRYRWTGKMHIRQLRIAFKIWGFGNFIAFIVFLYEFSKSGRQFDRFKTFAKKVTNKVKL